MTTGDTAAAAGLYVVPGTKDYRLGYDDINRRGDELATHMLTGTHPAEKITGQFGSSQIKTGAVTTSKIADGAVTRAKLDDGVLPHWGQAVITAPENTAHVVGTVRVAGLNIPVKTYDRLLFVDAYVDAAVDASTGYQLRLILADDGSTNSVGTGNVIGSVPLYNNTGAASRMGAHVAGTVHLADTDDKVVRVWLERTDGTGGIQVYDASGDTLRATYYESDGSNTWS